MNLLELTEMSMIIPPYSPHSSEEDVTDRYKKFVKILQQTNTYTKVSDIDSDVELYMKPNHYFAINNSTKKAVYSMEYKVNTNDVLHQYVTQTWVWRDTTAPTYLPAQVFFTLLDRFDTIVCDDEQTELGKKFWINQMNVAFSKNLNVYFFNFKTNLLVKLTTSLDIQEFNRMYNIWNITQSAKTKVFVISKLEL